MASNSPDFNRDVWQLFHLDEDFSEADDLSASFPDRLKALQDLFWIEAEKYNVLPLDDRFLERGDPRWRPSLIEGRTRFTYYPGARHIPESSSPLTKSRSYTMTAHVEVPEGGADGVLVAAGGVTAGYALYVKEGRPIFEYNYFTQERYKIAGPEKLPPGKSTIRFEFKYDGWGFARGGTGRLFVNGVKAAEGRIGKTVLGRFSPVETFDTGLDTRSPVSDAYQSPFPFQGKLNKVEFDIAPTKLTAEAERELRQTHRAFAVSSD
jgi:arylsulfatase